jgi:hypothetical protein
LLVRLIGAEQAEFPAVTDQQLFRMLPAYSHLLFVHGFLSLPILLYR